jgi:hypothetical protein
MAAVGVDVRSVGARACEQGPSRDPPRCQRPWPVALTAHGHDGGCRRGRQENSGRADLGTATAAAAPNHWIREQHVGIVRYVDELSEWP